jgi:type I restriction enzyme S subunit
VVILAHKAQPAYKASEFGFIPIDWEVREVADFHPFITSGSRGWARYYSESGAPFIRITNLSHDDINPDLSDLRHVRVPADEAEAIRTRLETGDVLVSITADIGAIGYVGPDLPTPAYINQHIACVRLPHDIIDSRYVAYFLASSGPQRRFTTMVDVGAKSGLNLTTVGKLKLLVPPLREQTAIAEALSEADALIESLEGLVAKKRAIKQGMMQELLSGRRRLSGFFEEWKTYRVSELEANKLVKLHRGEVISKLHIEATPGDFPIYSSSVHNGGLFGCYGNYMLDEELITWSIDGGGHFFYRPKHKFSVTNVCGYMRVDSSRVNCRFLASALQLAHSAKSFDYQTKAHPSVVRKEYEVRWPSLPEQSAIADVLNDLEEELVSLDKRLTKARQVKQGMMQELLTGRVRLA